MIFIFLYSPAVRSSEYKVVYFAKSYGGKNEDCSNVILKTQDGGYLVGGKTKSFTSNGSDAWIIKLNKCGNVVWQKGYRGGKGWLSVLFIEQTIDGGYITILDGTIIKLDKYGNIEWESNTLSVG